MRNMSSINSQKNSGVKYEEQVIIIDKDLSLQDAFIFSWQLWRSDPFRVSLAFFLVPMFIFFLGMCVLMLPLVLSKAATIFGGGVVASSAVSPILMLIEILFLLGMVAVFIITVGCMILFQMKFVLNLATGQYQGVKNVLKEIKRPSLLLRFAGSVFLYCLIVLVGMLFFVIPGVVLSIKYSFVPWLVLDKQMKIKEAFVASGEMTKGRKRELFIFWLLTVLVLLIPYIIFGDLIVAPVSLIISSYIYLIFSQEPNRLAKFPEKYSRLAVAGMLLIAFVLNLVGLLINGN